MRKCWIENLPGMPPLPPFATGYSRPDRVTAMRFLGEKQAWVLKKVLENVVAGYLGVMVDQFKEIRNL